MCFHRFVRHRSLQEAANFAGTSVRRGKLVIGDVTRVDDDIVNGDNWRIFLLHSFFTVNLFQVRGGGVNSRASSLSHILPEEVCC